MYNTSNPAELYPNTTWELLPSDKFLKTGNTPLQLAGSNNISISKANLPADKLQVESFSLTRGRMNITGELPLGLANGETSGYTGAFGAISKSISKHNFSSYSNIRSYMVNFNASNTWTGNTSSASPYTVAMGNGTPISINPEHITIKAWKRLS